MLFFQLYLGAVNTDANLHAISSVPVFAKQAEHSAHSDHVAWSKHALTDI